MTAARISFTQGNDVLVLDDYSLEYFLAGTAHSARIHVSHSNVGVKGPDRNGENTYLISTRSDLSSPTFRLKIRADRDAEFLEFLAELELRRESFG